MSLEQGGEAEEREEHLLISQLRGIRERFELTESMVPSIVVDLYGKVTGFPSSKPHKKRNKIKAFVIGALKEAKLLTSAMTAVGTINAYIELYLSTYACIL